MKKQAIPLTVLTVALAVSLTVNIVLWVTWPSNPPSENGAPSTTVATTPTTSKTLSDISTPYGVINFPATLTDVQHEVTEQNGVYSIAFSYPRGDETVSVFSVHFGDASLGTWVGDLEIDGTLVPFSVSSAENPVDDSWSAQEQEYFDVVNLAVNDVIASVQRWDSYRQ